MKTNRAWGRVTARPHEYLIQLRGGRIVRHGPGLSVFKWPWDSITRIPTSVQRASFVADQVTSEKVGVEVRGVAVFRVADPMLAFRMLEFGETHSMQRVTDILQDMFVGAVRRQVANMSVDACLTRRKEEIASELMREIAPVVSGAGRPDDATATGWGLVIDTIEIQDVRILSETVFENLQAPYRSDIEMKARRSTVERDREVHLRQVDSRKKTLEADLDLQRREHEADEARRLSVIQRDERVQTAELESTRRLAELEHERQLREMEQAAERTAEELEREFEGRSRRVELEGPLVERELEIERRRQTLRTDLRRLDQEVDNTISDERIKYALVTETVPAIARCLAARGGGDKMGQ